MRNIICISLLLILWITVFACQRNKTREGKTVQANKALCSRFSVSVGIFDMINGNTSPSHSWNPGYNGWDVGTPPPDSIKVVIKIEVSPLDFENNQPFDLIADANLGFVYSKTWDCLNPKDPFYFEAYQLINKKRISKNDFFSKDISFENLKPVELRFVVDFKKLTETIDSNIESTHNIAILNTLVVKVSLCEAANPDNKCTIEHRHPVCATINESIFDLGEE